MTLVTRIQKKSEKKLKSDGEWNRYLKKYDSLYVVNREEDGVWVIKCSKKGGEWNTIRPHNLDSVRGVFELAYVTFGTTQQRDTYILKKFEHVKHRIHCKGSDGMIVVFQEKDLGAVTKVVRPINRRKKKPIRKTPSRPESKKKVEAMVVMGLENLCKKCRRTLKGYHSKDTGICGVCAGGFTR